jgi:hypothetical protein
VIFNSRYTVARNFENILSTTGGRSAVDESSDRGKYYLHKKMLFTEQNIFCIGAADDCSDIRRYYLHGKILFAQALRTRARLCP